jgi:hypothetical protein
LNGGAKPDSALFEAVAQFTRALDQIATLPGTPALRREQIKPEQAHSLIERAEALGEPAEDPLLLFVVLYGIWVTNAGAFNGDAAQELAAQFLTLAEKQGRQPRSSSGTVSWVFR